MTLRRQASTEVLDIALLAKAAAILAAAKRMGKATQINMELCNERETP